MSATVTTTANGAASTAAGAEASYGRICAACHGVKGEGGKGPPIAPPAYDAAQMVAIVRSGQGQMPPIPKAALSDDDLSAIVSYLETLQ